MDGLGTTETDILGSLNPKHCVVGVVDTSDEVQAAIEALKTAGFTNDLVSSSSGGDLLENHRQHEANKGIGAKIAGLFPSQEDDVLKAYLSEAEAGAWFVTVLAKNDEERDRVADALRSVGARLLRYYADYTIVDLSKNRDIQSTQG